MPGGAPAEGLATAVEPPVAIEGWRYLDPEREAEYPIPYSSSVRDVCDDTSGAPELAVEHTEELLTFRERSLDG